MEADRPADMLFLLDCMEDLSSKGADSRFAGRIDTTRCALTGMSFGGWSTAAALESRDPRVKAAILQCPSLSMSGSGTLAEERQEIEVPVMVQLGTEDTVIGEAGNEAGRRYVQTHNGPAYCVEDVRGGHVSFTSGMSVLYHSTTLLLYYSTALLLYCSTTLLLYYSTTLLNIYSTTVVP